MVTIPHSLTDFYDALRMLYESQGDVTEIVTKWDLICDTEVARTVPLDINGTTKLVDNLAKMRNDLVEGLSLDNPTVKSVTLQDREGNSGNINYGRWFTRISSASNNPFEDRARGSFRNTNNDYFTARIPDHSPVTANLLDMPRFVFVGGSRGAVTPITNFEIIVTAPSASYAQDDTFVDDQYCAMTTFVNMHTDAVTLGINDGEAYTSYSIQYKKSRTFLFFASAGMNKVNVQEISPEVV